MSPSPPHAPPTAGEGPTAGAWARGSWATLKRVSRSAKALFTKSQGSSEGSEACSSEKRRSGGWAASLPLLRQAGRGRPDPSAEEEHGGGGSDRNESMFSRPYALSSAHEEVVSAFASGQRRLAGQLARQRQWDPAAAAAAEREVHLAILRDHFGRGFLRKALKMLEDEGGADEAAPMLDAAKQQQARSSVAPAVPIHATAWSPPPAAQDGAGPLMEPPLHPPRSATPSFRLTAHTSTEGEEIDADNCC